jgi:hypothetical protein
MENSQKKPKGKVIYDKTTSRNMSPRGKRLVKFKTRRGWVTFYVED